jgi:hypothetical protein
MEDEKRTIVTRCLQKADIYFINGDLGKPNVTKLNSIKQN